MKTTRSRPWTYVVEFNRPRGDNINRCVPRLERRGIDVTHLPHLTTLRIERPRSMSFRQFKAALRAELHPDRGSLLLSSTRTGNVFVCSNRGNRPGKFLNIIDE